MKRALMTLIVAAAALFAGCDVGSDEPGTGAEPPARASCEPELERGLRAWAQAGFSGSIAISVEGTLECVAAYGTAERDSGRANTPETVFSIGSITKAFTAAGVLELAHDGKLSLSDRAGDLLPQLRGPVARATVRQLLLHTSGLKGTKTRRSPRSAGSSRHLRRAAASSTRTRATRCSP